MQIFSKWPVAEKSLRRGMRLPRGLPATSTLGGDSESPTGEGTLTEGASPIGPGPLARESAKRGRCLRPATFKLAGDARSLYL